MSNSQVKKLKYSVFRRVFSGIKLLIIATSLVGGIFLVKQNQDLRSRAAQEVICPPDKETYNIETDFGANGKDDNDDYEGLLLASLCLSNTTGKTLIFPEGTFHIKRYRITADTSDGRSKNDVQRITYQNVSNLRILGAGSDKTKIVVKGDFFYSADEHLKEEGKNKYLSNVKSVVPFFLLQCNQCLISGFELYGENDKTTIDPKVFQPGASTGIYTSDSINYTISDVYAHHFIGDGLYIGSGSNGLVDEGAIIINSRFTNNGRTGAAVIQARNITFVNSQFSKGVFFSPQSASHIEPNISDLTKINKYTGDVFYYNSSGSVRDSGRPQNLTGSRYRTMFTVPLEINPEYKTDVSLSAKIKYGSCQTKISYPVATLLNNEVIFSSETFDIDEDGKLDDDLCHAANFQLLKGRVEFSLPSGSKTPKKVELKLNDSSYDASVSIKEGNKLVVNTEFLPNGRWKMKFSAKDGADTAIPIAAVPVIIANERPSFPTSTSTMAITGSVKIDLKLKFQGITTKPTDARNSMLVKLTLSGGDLTTPMVKSAIFISDANGVWSGQVGFDLNSPAGKKYILYVKGPRHIQKKICDIAPIETSPDTYSCSYGNFTLAIGDNSRDLSKVLLLSGDIYGPDKVQDGVINSIDLAYIKNNLNTTDAVVLNVCDINLDGRCDTQDYSLIISALQIKTDEL